MTDTERERINAICEVAGVTEIDDLSDGFHTFRQLYYQRMMLFAAIVRQNKDKAWKSLRHEDGELCFGGGWFIVGIDTPEGSYTYHYEDNYYSLFDCEELERGKHWDGHTEKDVTRLLSLPKAQLSQEGTTEGTTSALNNQVNLYDSCICTYPECPSEKDDVIFGNGIGNDNICACNKYQPTVQPVATDINVGDTISLRQAIDAINHICPVDTEYDCTLLDRVDVRCVLSDLPTIQPVATDTNVGNNSEIPNNSDCISKALDTDAEPEPTTLHEWAVTMCRSSGCHRFDGFGCTRSDVVTDGEGTCPCDIERRTE